MVHHRSLRLSPDGLRLSGLDRFLGPDGRPRPKLGKDKATIRFHLHPSVSAARTDNPERIMLFAAGSVRLVFECLAIEPQLEESIFFAATGGARRCSQIVLRASTTETAEISWTFTRAARRPEWTGKAGECLARAALLCYRRAQGIFCAKVRQHVGQGDFGGHSRSRDRAPGAALGLRQERHSRIGQSAGERRRRDPVDRRYRRSSCARMASPSPTFRRLPAFRKSSTAG